MTLASLKFKVQNSKFKKKEKRIQAPKFIYGKFKEIFSETRSARKKASLFQAPKFILVVLNFEL
ncbi:hypothetical protein DP117_13510 [Brasilonema sp. UFV-L1]|nr:hypothetical protein [Brasilonema sp. UFV-L1]